MINDAYHLVIDAILGLEADPANVKEPYAGMLVTLKQVKIPIASVDVPSGESGSVSEAPQSLAWVSQPSVIDGPAGSPGSF